MENNSSKASLNLSKEGKKKIHFLEEEDFFLKRGGKWIDFIELQLIDQRREWKIILGNLSNEGKKKIQFPEEEDLFLKREENESTNYN